LRLYLHEPDKQKDEVYDPNARIIERMKANYAARGDQIRLRWRHGVIIREGADAVDAPGMTSMGKLDAKNVFLDLVREFAAQNRPVSSKNRASNYAPREFGRLPREQRFDFRQIDFEIAMNRLFKEGKIENAQYGRKGDTRTQISIRENSGPA
jgi:hypothetical protein